MLILSGTLVLFSICTQINGLFSPNSDIVYQYHATIRTGTLTPARGSSDWELRGKLRLQVLESSITLKFYNLSVSIFNGKHGEDPDSLKIFQPIPIEANDLYEPFVIHFNEGKVKNISVSNEESTWSINIKRALSSLFQLEEEKFNLPAFISKEDTLYGQCDVEYTLSNEANKLLVRKFIDHATCQGYPRLVWKNTSPLLCPSGHKVVSSSSGKLYSLVPRDKYFSLERLEINSGLDVQPFRAHGELSYAFVNQSMFLISDNPITEDIPISDNLKSVDLKYELPATDMTQGRSPFSNEEYLKMVDLYLRRIIDSLERNPFHQESQLMHNEYVPHLLYFLSLLKRPYLEEYYNNLAIGTSYYQETHRNLFLKLLPQVGSDDAILLIQDLVSSGREKEKIAIELLTVLPFYIRHPSEDLLKSSEKLLNMDDKIIEEVKQSAHLTFSIMIHKICRLNCRPETLEKYVRLFVDKFAGSRSYSEQMLYLEVLNNIELGNVFDYMIPIIQGNVSVFTSEPHHIRFLGVWASMSQAIFHPGKVHQIYWPILTNRSEHLEMRVAALTMLILAKPSHSNFINLLWFMQSEKNTHLQHFYYTTMESLIETKYPCYTGLGMLASYVIRYIRPPAIRNWATGNYILDYSDSKYGFGGLAQLFAVANQRTGNPNVFYLLVNSHAMDHNLRQFAIYIKLEGVNDAMNKMIFRDNKFLNFSDLINILQDIKAPTIVSEDIHIEIIAKIENQVVYCQYINRTNFHKLIEVVSNIDLMAQEVSINYQTVKAPLLMEITQPLDIGVPVLLRTESTVVTSIRGNFTKDWSGSHQFRRNELDIRYSFNSGLSLIIYNPVLNLWHTTRRSISYNSYFASNISIHINNQNIGISFADQSGTPRGIVAHARTSVKVYGKDSSKLLDVYCPSCKNLFVVLGNNERSKQEIINIPAPELGTNVKLSLYDCEQSYSTKHLFTIIKSIFIESNKNYRVLPVSQLFLGIIHSLDHLSLVPPKGSCGIQFEISPSMKEGTEVILSNSLLDLNNEKKIRFTLDLKSLNNQKSLKTWIFTTTFGTHDEDTKHNLEINVTSLVEGKDQGKVCFTGETLFPKPKNGLLPWNPSDDVTAKTKVVWGNNNESCPSNGGDIEILAFGKVTDEQKKLSQNSTNWPHAACLEDTKNVEEWGHGYTPITEACYRASIEVATLRKYTAIFTFNKAPKSFNFWRRKITAFTDIFHTGFVTPSSDEFSNLTVSLEIPINKQVILKVNNKQLAFPKVSSNWLKPFLINTYLHAIVPHVMTFGMIGSCVVNSANVISIDNITRSFSASPCYTLITGDCTAHPRFAVFVRRIKEAKPLAAKVYLDGYNIEIIPVSNGKLKIFLNDATIETDKKGYQITSENKDVLLIRQLEEGLIRVTSQNSHIWLQHNGHFLTLVIPNIYGGQLCGLCGDFNGDASNDVQEILSIPCSDT